MSIYTSQQMLTIQLPDDLIVSNDNIGIIRLIGTHKRYLPRIIIMYHRTAGNMPLRHEFMTFTKSNFREPQILSEPIEYKDKTPEYRYRGFSVILTHEKYEKLWGGPMTFLSTTFTRKFTNTNPWSFTLTAQFPTTADTASHIAELHTMLLSISPTPQADARYNLLIDDRWVPAMGK